MIPRVVSDEDVPQFGPHLWAANEFSEKISAHQKTEERISWCWLPLFKALSIHSIATVEKISRG